ncbi:MAG: YfhO family protein [Vicinamibacterales bacterium]
MKRLHFIRAISRVTGHLFIPAMGSAGSNGQGPWLVLLGRHVAPLAWLVVIALAGIGFLITHPDGLLNQHSDLVADHLGRQTIFHDTWQNEHRLPLWRSDIMSGLPALTNPQSLYTHPVHLLFAFVRPERVVGLVVFLQMLFAGIGGYCAASVLRLSTPARLLVGVATLFSFKTIMAAYAGWLPVLTGIAAMPVLFAAIALVFERATLSSALWLGGAGALALHTGHPQLAYYTVLFIVLWSLFTIVRLLLAGDRHTAMRVVQALTLAALVACGLSAYLILPIARDLPLVTRGAADYDFFIASRPFPVQALLTLLNPELFGTPLHGRFRSWEYVVYFGAVPSLLALVAVIQCRGRAYVVPMIAGLVLSIMLAVNSPLLTMVYSVVPGFGLLRIPQRILFVSSLFAFLLAGVGLDKVLSATNDRRTKSIVAATLIALVALEGSVWARRYLRAPTPVPVPVRAEYVKALSHSEPARIAPLAHWLPSYGSAAALGLELAAGPDPFNMRHYQRYLDLLRYAEARAPRAEDWTIIDDIRRYDMLDALNVLYVVAPSPIDAPADRFSLIAAFDNQPQFRFHEAVQAGSVYVYRNRRFLARAFFVSNVVSATDEDDMARVVETVNVRDTAVVVAPAGSGSSVADAGDSVKILRSTPGALEIAVQNAQRRFLVVSEVWHPGWHASVDGRPATVYQADIALLGLWLEPGAHAVELRFWPPGLTVGLMVTLLTCIGVAAMVVVVRRPRP